MHDAEQGRRVPPLRLERLLLGAVAAVRPRLPRAALPDHPGHALVAHLHRRHQARSDRGEDPQDHRARGGLPQDRLLAPAHRPLRARRASTSARSAAAARTAPTARPASSSWTARPSRSSAAGRSTAARRSCTTTSGGTCRATTWCRANGRCRRSSRTASSPRTCWPTSTAIACTSGTCAARRNVQTIDLGANHQMALEVRPAHDPGQGIRLPRRRGRHHQPRRLDLDLVARGRQVPHREDGDHPARAGAKDAAAAAAAGLRRGAAAGHATSTCRWTTASSTSPAGAPARCASTTSRTR